MLVHVILNTGTSTYVMGSNMFESMKHCVAIGGVCVVGAGGAPGAAGGGGAVPGAMFRALAATWGIWNPVPATKKT